MSSRGNVKNTYFDVHYSFTFSIWTADMALIRGFHSSSDKEAVSNPAKTIFDLLKNLVISGNIQKSSSLSRIVEDITHLKQRLEYTLKEADFMSILKKSLISI